MRAAWTPWTSDDDATLRTLRGQGNSCTEIAEVLGRTHAAVKNRSRVLGGSFTPDPPRQIMEWKMERGAFKNFDQADMAITERLRR